MVSAQSSMDFSQELPPFLFGDAPLEHSGRAFLIKSMRESFIRKSTTGVLQRCISEEEGQNLLAEIHARLGGHHAAARALVGKAFRTGFYWPIARANAQDLVQ